MASELLFTFSSGKICYFVVTNRVGQVWNISLLSFETYNQTNFPNYAISATEQGASHRYTGTFPAIIVPGVYGVEARQQLGAFAAHTDPTVAMGDFQWNGSATLPLADLATSGQIGQIAPIKMARGVAVPNFPVYLKSAADHVTPFTSGVLSGQISRDGNPFGPLQSGAFTEVGLGAYSLQALTSGDLLAQTVTLHVQGVGISGGTSDPLVLSFVLQRTSGAA